MTHSVLVLDDQKRSGEATVHLVNLRDPGASVELVRSVEAAIAKLKALENQVAYVIVDLLLEPSPEDRQGETLVEWMMDSPTFRSTPVVILSAFPLMIKSLKPQIRTHAQVITRTMNLNEMYETLTPIIEGARRKFDMRGAGGGAPGEMLRLAPR